MLFVCATPIGNLGDVSRRLLDTLATVQYIACEDTRHTLKLLTHYAIKGPRLISLHEHNETQRVEELLPLLREGADIALVSDAGTPLISDPGYELIRACRKEGIAVTAIPGASAAVVALVLSGLPVDRVLFTGFLPRRHDQLEELLDDASRVQATLVAFESPRRVRGTLGVLAESACEVEVAMCRELTKVHEEVIVGSPGEVAARMPERVRGEIVLVVRVLKEALLPLPQDPADEESYVHDLLRDQLHTKDIAQRLAERLGCSRSAAYRRVLEIRKKWAGTTRVTNKIKD
ncbi:MAG: 16S rRNA (cytidine(1402)-2'-O)-methyltransferase [Actinobacteria bacterium]|nr:16S rRNA (cytidine(1402)-2'-O)-methyltransferase [Actinomycetota bacterium]